MHCELFQHGICHSCKRLAEPYPQQLAAKQADIQQRLAPFAAVNYLSPVSGPEEAFRNKAKMAVTGTSDKPVLGIVDEQGQGVDLRDCPLYPAEFASVFATLAEFISRAGLQPYDISRRTGELKFVLLTQSFESKKFLLRFVLRSTLQIETIRQHLEWLQYQQPELSVISINIQPVPMAIIEGDEEIVLTDEQALYDKWNGVPLYIRPRSFFQTNPVVAANLYATAREWTEEINPQTIWDLFCGVGGFGLHCATVSTALTGIEIAEDAIASAQQSAQEIGLQNVQFMALPSADFASNQSAAPDLLIANPPRRGLGKSLCDHLQQLKPANILYSSCNARTLADDICHLSDYRLEKVQLFDMFPHTNHYETLVLLIRNF